MVLMVILGFEFALHHNDVFKLWLTNVPGTKYDDKLPKSKNIEVITLLVAEIADETNKNKT